MDADVARLTASTGPGWLSPWLGPWLDWLDAALHQEILRLRARHELSRGELRGLYIDDAQVEELVARRAPAAEAQARLAGLDEHRTRLLEEARSVPSPVRELACRFAIDDIGLLAVVLCVAPEVELSYQSLYAYLNDDVTRRLPTVDLCQRIAGGLLRDDAGVVAEGLVRADRLGSATVWGAAGLVLPDPVRRFLLSPDPVPALATPTGASALPHVVVIEAAAEVDALAEASARAAAAARRLVIPDSTVVDRTQRLRDAVLEARLHGAVLRLTGSDVGLTEESGGHAAPELWGMVVDAGVDVLLALKPGAGDRLPLSGVDHERVVLGPLDLEARVTQWTLELGAHGVDVRREDVDAVSSLFALSGSQISAAATSLARAGRADLESLGRAARTQCTSGIAGVAEAVPAVYRWDDLVLPGPTLRRLVGLAGAIRHRHQVFDAWSFGRLQGGHASVRALFSGASGTGKTMAASVLARDLGLELYRVDLSTVVSKYIGETEKNLERVLAAAENSNALLFFDEADALFGKRSEVRDAHDRYANIEIAFLLQRVESYDGVMLLATNLAGNLDDAFHRRIHFHVEFPMPDEAARERLWRQAIPDTAPIDEDVDPLFLAGMFPLTGGEIRSASLMAAFMAADEGAPIGMTHLTRALARQRRQQGKLPSSAEFQGFLRLVQQEGG